MENNGKVAVLCFLPPTGLGNRLVVWAHALIFARKNNLPLFVSPWERLTIAPLLRGDKQMRFYTGQFKRKDYLQFFKHSIQSYFVGRIEEPDLNGKLQSEHRKMTYYTFSRLPHWSQYFTLLKDHRDLITSELMNMLSLKSRQFLSNTPSPQIAIHIRRGDFRELKSGEDFAKVGSVRTPLSYFRSLILGLRSVIGNFVPISIFSDAPREELQAVLELPNTTLQSSQLAIVDIIAMSRSRLIILSAGSTFGLWAAFLSNAAVLHHPDHFHGPIRDMRVNEHSYEGAITGNPSQWPFLFQQNLQSIAHSSSLL